MVEVVTQTNTQAQWGLLADAVLGLHLGIAAFVVLGQLAIIAGGIIGSKAVRNLRFRLTHLALIVFIAAQTMLGQLCPLTHLEQYLRLRAGQNAYSESFTQHWLTPLLFFDAPWWVFTTLHSVTALVVIATWWLVPPDWSGRGAADSKDADALSPK